MKKQYEYKFVSVKLSLTWTGKVKEDYRQDIKDNARDGWRFVQAFSTSYGAQGNVDLIFEREVE